MRPDLAVQVAGLMASFGVGCQFLRSHRIIVDRALMLCGFLASVIAFVLSADWVKGAQDWQSFAVLALATVATYFTSWIGGVFGTALVANNLSDAMKAKGWVPNSPPANSSSSPNP